MTKRYAILQKKIEELESDLIEVFQLPADQTPCRQLLSDGIEQRFVFLKNLLSAEMASHPSKPHHLQHIAIRLDELDTAFRDWDNYRANDFDAVSTCSCTESCLNEDCEALPDLGSLVYDHVLAEEERVEAEADCKALPDLGSLVYDHVPAEKGRVEAEAVAVEVKRSVWIWRHCGVPMVGAVVMGFLVVNFSACFHYFEHEGVLTPT